MKALIKVLLTASLLIFAMASLLEWKYYVEDRRQASEWTVTSSQKTAERQSEQTDRRPTDRAKTEKELPRKLGGNLQSLVEKSPDLLIEQQSAISHPPIRSTPNYTALLHQTRRNLPDPAIVVFCYNRATYLEETLSSLASLPALEHFTLYISQDGNDTAVASVSSGFVNSRLKPPGTRAIEHWQHTRKPLLSIHQPGHAWLTQHYRWALDRVFKERNHTHAIIVEDDMLFSEDFLTFFTQTAPLLDSDPTLWCISTWNDNGLSHLGWKNDRLFRTSYFPGLGWMLRRQLWDELGPKFPLQAWDHWMRLDGTSNGRECISPEVNRNKNIGKRGANMQTSVFNRYLAHMMWSKQPVFSWGKLANLELPSYNARLQKLLDEAEIWKQPINARAVESAKNGKVYLIPYKGEDYLKLARAFRIWPFPRGHHHHLGVLPFNGATFLLADQRFCTFLPEALRVFPSPSLRALAGSMGQSCDAVCGGAGLTCESLDFWFINSCEELSKHFLCEKGCAAEVGFDVPNYVSSPDLPTFQSCLVTQAQSRCSASHKGTRRLCPCVQVSDLGKKQAQGSIKMNNYSEAQERACL